MQHAASVFGADLQAKGMGLWGVAAMWRDDQSLHTPPNCKNTFYSDIPYIWTVNVLRIFNVCVFTMQNLGVHVQRGSYFCFKL